LFALILAVSTTSAQTTDGTFQNAGLTLHYTATGKGSPVLILSGGPGMDVDYMRPVADMLAPTHTVILLEQRGTGRSMPSAITPETVNGTLLLSDIEALRNKLGYRQWIILGHSAGSVTAEFYAIAHPDAIHALVLTGALPPTLAEIGSANDNLMARLSPEAKAQMTAPPAPNQTPAQQAEAIMRVIQVAFAADFYDSTKGNTFAATQTLQNFHMNTMEMLEKSTSNYDLHTELASLHMPVLIIQGRQDPYDPQLAGETRDAIPGARMIIVEKAGHFTWLEQPEVYRKALVDFLQDK
jgi:proline iminopeptidase